MCEMSQPLWCFGGNNYKTISSLLLISQACGSKLCVNVLYAIVKNFLVLFFLYPQLYRNWLFGGNGDTGYCVMFVTSVDITTLKTTTPSHCT